MVQQQLGDAQEWVNAIIEKPLPPLLIAVIQEMVKEKLLQAAKDVDKQKDESEDRALAVRRISELQAAVSELLSLTIDSYPRNKLSNNIEKPMEAALKTILASAKTPKIGIELSVKVINAIERA